MLGSPKWRTALLSLAMLGAAAAPAHAEITASEVTSPADGTRLFTTFDSTPSREVTVTVTANVTGTGEAVVACRRGAAVHAVTGPFDVTSASVTREVKHNVLWGPCRLVVVPSAGAADLAPFTGPVVHGGYLELRRDANGRLEDFYAMTGSKDSSGDYVSFGNCGFWDTMLHYGADHHLTSYGAYCNGYPGPQPDRTPVRIDGKDAVEPYHARDVASGFPETRPELGVEVEHDAVTGDMTITETVPFTHCTDDACTKLEPAGVALTRRVLHRKDGTFVSQQDAWKSTDGQPHTVDYQTWDDFCSGAGCQDAQVRLPGSASFVDWPTAPTTLTGNGPLSLLVRSSTATDEPDPAKPVTGVTYPKAPGALTFRDSSSSDSYFENLEIAIPAGGTTYRSRVYTLAPSVAIADALVAEAETSLKPTVDIDAPSAVADAALTLKGAVTADQGTPEVTVNGKPAKVEGQKWSLDVTLSEGANPFEVVATNAYGQTAKVAHTVTYTKPVVVTPPVTKPPVTLPAKPTAFSLIQALLGAKAKPIKGLALANGVLGFTSGKPFSVKARTGKFDKLAFYCPAACTISGSGKLSYTPAKRKGKASAARSARKRTIKVTLKKLAVPAGQARTARLRMSKKSRRALKRVKRGKATLKITAIAGGRKATDRVSISLRVR